MEKIRTSAKNLGAMALSDFCPRCFWIKLHVKNLPWQIFPGIFSSIDSYTKKIAHSWIDNGVMPHFMQELGVTGWIKTLHWSKFIREHKDSGIILSGIPDDLWAVKGGHVHIPDFKTAKFTENQDKLLPMYEIQENGYGWIAEGQGMDVNGLSLIYMEPQTDEDAANIWASPEDFKLPFTPKFVPIDKDYGKLDVLLNKVRKIYDEPAPDGLQGCKDCMALAEIFKAIKK